MKTILLSLLLLIGCSSAGDMKALSSEQVGCSPSEITIEQHSETTYSTNWTAACEDRTYRCVQDESSDVYTVSCTATD